MLSILFLETSAHDINRLLLCPSPALLCAYIWLALRLCHEFCQYNLRVMVWQNACHGQRIGQESSIKVSLQYVAHDLSQSKRE